MTTRTIQRVEQGHRPSLETCRARAIPAEVKTTTTAAQSPPRESPAADKANGRVSSKVVWGLWVRYWLRL